jgi:hypothetical protein
MVTITPFDTFNYGFVVPASGRYVLPWSPPVMTIEQPFHIYQEQLSSIYHGLALWKPNPEGLYDRVTIGDVGYVNEGAFIRMFNVTLPCDDESNKTLGDPFHYGPLSPDSFTIRSETFGKSDHYSRGVSREDNAHNIHAKTPDQ